MSRIVAGLIGVLCAACASRQTVATAVPTQTLEAWFAPSPEVTGPPPGPVAPIRTPGPTPTPFSHRVEPGDTLLGIALEYGVELNDLLLANPGINPRFLVVGSELVVPLAEGTGPVPTATPRPVTLSSVACYPAGTGELWCFVTASLGDGPPIEGLIGLITLLDAAGEPLRTEPAFGPLNLLRPGAELPLVAYFAPPVADFRTAAFTLLSAVSAGESIERYLSVEVNNVETTISSDRQLARVEGALEIGSPPDGAPARVRLLAVAIDSAGRVAGLTTVTNEDLVGDGPGYLFSLQLASLGPPIERVELYAEAIASEA